MHVYIYDNFVNEPKYSKLIAKLETRITDLGLNGKICRVGMMQNINSMAENEINRGVKTIIAVGDDTTFAKIINSLADKKVPLGFIPIGKNNSIAKALGIFSHEDACNILASRRVEIIDLGQANANCFINKASISTVGTIIENDSGYSIEINGQGSIDIVNMPLGAENSVKIKSIPNDEKLELTINIEEGGMFSKNIDQTILPFNCIKILNNKLPVILDGQTAISTPVEIKLSTKKLSVIVGKDRIF